MTTPKKILILLGSLIIITAIFLLVKPSSVKYSETQGAINFTETGYISDREPDKFNDGLYLVYEKPGTPALSAKLAFDEKSTCAFGGQNIVCMALNVTIDTATQGKRVFLTGIQTNDVVLVRNLEILQ